MNLLTAAGLVLLYKRVVAPLLQGLAGITVALLRATTLLPFHALHSVRLTRSDPPPPFRGTHTNSGRPLRSFADSIQDLQS